MGGPPSCRRVRNSLAQRTHAPAQASLYKPAERIQPEACDKGPRDTHLGHSFLSPGLDVDAGGKGRRQSGHGPQQWFSGGLTAAPGACRKLALTARGTWSLPETHTHGPTQPSRSDARRVSDFRGAWRWTDAHPAFPIRRSGGVRLQRGLEVDRRPPSPPNQTLWGWGEGSEFREAWRWTDAHPDLPIRCSGGVRLQRGLEVDRYPPRPPDQTLRGYPISERPGGGQTPTQPSRSDARGVSDFREAWRWTDAHPDLPIRCSGGGVGGLTSEGPGGGQTPTETFPIRCSGGGVGGPTSEGPGGGQMCEKALCSGWQSEPLNHNQPPSRAQGLRGLGRNHFSFLSLLTQEEQAGF